MNNNGNASGAPYGRYGHVAAVAQGGDEGAEGGVLMLGGKMGSDDNGVWWEKRPLSQRPTVTRCVWVLDVCGAAWGKRVLEYAYVETIGC